MSRDWNVACIPAARSFPTLKFYDAHVGNRMRSVLRFARYLPLFLAVLMVIGPSPASAQVASGSISGSVSDPQSSAVPDATGSAANQATNREVATTTDSSGQFRLSLLEPGKYRVEISKQGFR